MVDQRLRILYVLKILWEETDETHPISATELAKRIESYGIHCERKSIYLCLDSLELFGFDIVRQRSGAYMGQRLLELPELKLLVDAVQSAKFITEKKSNELIAKLGVLAGKRDAAGLKRQVYVKNRVKSMDENIYYSIDSIHEGIQNDKQIRFIYCKWDGSKKLVPKHDGSFYVISPWFLMWEREKYYLIGYDERARQMKHYRVDKMKEISVLEEPRQGREEFEQLDMATYAIQNFSMFQGETETVTLRLEAAMIGVLIDRFGTEVWLHLDKDGYYTALLNVSVSDQFFGWLTGLGGKVAIIRPRRVVEQYKRLLMQCMRQATYTE